MRDITSENNINDRKVKRNGLSNLVPESLNRTPYTRPKLFCKGLDLCFLQQAKSQGFAGASVLYFTSLEAIRDRESLGAGYWKLN